VSDAGEYFTPQYAHTGPCDLSSQSRVSA